MPEPSLGRSRRCFSSHRKLLTLRSKFVRTKLSSLFRSVLWQHCTPLVDGVQFRVPSRRADWFTWTVAFAFCQATLRGVYKTRASPSDLFIPALCFNSSRTSPSRGGGCVCRPLHSSGPAGSLRGHYHIIAGRPTGAVSV